AAGQHIESRAAREVGCLLCVGRARDRERQRETKEDKAFHTSPLSGCPPRSSRVAPGTIKSNGRAGGSHAGDGQIRTQSSKVLKLSQEQTGKPRSTCGAL